MDKLCCLGELIELPDAIAITMTWYFVSTNRKLYHMFATREVLIMNSSCVIQYNWKYIYTL